MGGIGVAIQSLPFFIGVEAMPPPRKNPPNNAAETIRTLATRGFSQVGIASQMGVSKSLLGSWFERFPLLEDAFELGKDTQRQRLHEMLYDKALAKGDTLAALSILNSLHGWRDPKKGSVDVNVDVKVQNVMVVKDHGSDDEWAAKVSAQQQALVLDAAADASRELRLTAPKSEPEATPEAAALALPTWYPTKAPTAKRSVPAEPTTAPTWKPNG